MTLTAGYTQILQVIRKLSLSRSLQEITVAVRSAARSIAQADGATFVLKQGRYCFYVDEDAIGPLWKGQKFPLEMCVSGWSMLHQKAVVIRDIYKDHRVPQDAYRPTFVRSLAITPIRQSSPIGAIGTYWANEHEPSEEKMELLQALADAVSVAIENVNLYDDLEKRIQELNVSNRAKDDFLMIVSHELRTPLTAILGWSQMLKDPSIATQQNIVRGLKIIERNALLQNQIVDDLLDGSQIILGRLKLKLASIDLQSPLFAAMESIKPYAESKNIAIILEAPADPIMILGDSGRLQQVFGNLLTNAIKFSPNHSSVFISLTKEGPNGKIKVIDQGIGIDDAFKTKIFERFRQADSSSTTRKYGGLGLGLSIVKHLILAHEGNIEAISDGVGKGTTFSIQLPLVKDKNHQLANESTCVAL